MEPLLRAGAGGSVCGGGTRRGAAQRGGSRAAPARLLGRRAHVALPLRGDRYGDLPVSNCVLRRRRCRAPRPKRHDHRGDRARRKKSPPAPRPASAERRPPPLCARRRYAVLLAGRLVVVRHDDTPALSRRVQPPRPRPRGEGVFRDRVCDRVSLRHRALRSSRCQRGGARLDERLRHDQSRLFRPR